jgi:glycosyltransferase involved in cell wall biosynthesis
MLAAALRPAAGRARRRYRAARDARAVADSRIDLAVFHDFAPAPAGGANQTLRAVLAAMEQRGVAVNVGAASASTRAILFNSFNFDADRLAYFARRKPAGCRVVHRVGAVTTLYRGVDDGTDAHVAELNRRFADATIAISQATIDMYRSIGIELVAPRVVHNGIDPAIFHPEGRVPWSRDRKTRLIAVSWSDNPRKGGPVYRWLESALDRDRYEFTYVGNVQESFDWIRHVPPVPSHELAGLLREHDVFVTATQHDAYSNALVEALSCGLPAIYLASGGSAEAVKEAGFAFSEQEEIPALLDRLRDEYEERRARISLPTLDEIVDAYLDALGLGEFTRAARGG